MQLATRARTSLTKVRIAFGCAIASVLILVFSVLAIWIMLGQSGRDIVSWTRDSSEPIDPEDFLVVLFPVEPLVDQPAADDGGATVDRAVLASLSELNQPTITIFRGDGSSAEVSLKTLTALPPSRGTGMLLDNLNLQIKKWGSETDWRRVELEFDQEVPHGKALTLIVFTKRGDRLKYHYEVGADGEVTPVRSAMRARFW
jgi:hypothetical protein